MSLLFLFFFKQSKPTSNTFLQLEKHYGEKYPECLKRILIASGFGTTASLRHIDEQSLSAIEEFMQDNRDLIDSLNCCNKEQYQRQREFRFLPGHKCIVLAIPGQLNQMTQNCIDAKTQRKSLLSDDEFTNKLITNLKTYFTSKSGFEQGGVSDDVLSHRNIINFVREEGGARCTFTCPFCPKTIPVKFNQYWRTSNVTSHLREHITGKNSAEAKTAE